MLQSLHLITSTHHLAYSILDRGQSYAVLAFTDTGVTVWLTDVGGLDDKWSAGSRGWGCSYQMRGCRSSNSTPSFKHPLPDKADPRY
jgi:hypothetical protein